MTTESNGKPAGKRQGKGKRLGKKKTIIGQKGNSAGPGSANVINAKEEEYIIKYILAIENREREGKTEYLVEWDGHPRINDLTWEPELEVK
ncbi:hypothetical protein VTL71DRAFT_9441 [Oculimacula yallundae]|uniref:Chromo domain-containing protein n=1 Tax=Oculimacula yallundae TaxID=86028 RepID=A0ABR4BT89_9HELO